MGVDIEKLEDLAKSATHGRWFVSDCCDNKKFYAIKTSDVFIGETLGCYNGKANAAYITAACNAVPELIAENRDLQKRVCELEKQRNWLAEKHAIACIDAACDACTSHIGDCPICPLPQGTGLCIEVSEVTFINAAEQATKED